jgi:NAD(P)-dependent dehydrogenase (short-subunit alcohol dehydrogenase family)
MRDKSHIANLYFGDTIMFDFSTRVVLVTGANGNLGCAVAQAFARANAKLILMGRSKTRIQQALPNLASSPDARIIPTDMTDADAVEIAVQAACNHFGHIDILTNTVGGCKAGTLVHETPLDTWDAMLRFNARIAFLISRAIVPVMLEQSYGKIIHVAARAGLRVGRKAAAYSAAKSAIIRLTESLAAEYKTQGINANCVLPGIIDTPQNRAAMPKADFSTWVAPEDIAQVILFLASDVAKSIHGAAIPTYGLS